MNFRLSLIALMALAVSPGFAQSAPMPNPLPPSLAADPLRQSFQLKVNTIIDKNKTSGLQPAFESGGKQALFHTNSQRDFFRSPERFALVFRNQEIASVSFAGYLPGVGGGMPFQGKADSKGELSIDEKAGAVSFKKEYLAGKDKRAVFSFSLKSIGEGKLKLDWSLGLSEPEIANLPPNSSFGLRICMEDFYRKLGVKLGGKDVTLTPDSEMAVMHAAIPDGKWFSEPRLVVAANASSVSVGDSRQLEGFELSSDSPFVIQVQESMARRAPEGRQMSINMNFVKIKPSGSMTLDLGATADDKSPYPAISGVDFWKGDQMHVPKLPTKNLLPNPSFEQGLRYWTWQVRGGGNDYKPNPKAPACYEISSDAKFGSQALKINATQGNRGITSFPLPLTVGKEYTVSFYSKGGSVKVSRFPSLPETGRKWEDLVASVDAQPGDDWKRTSFSFKAIMPAECIALSSYSGCLVDGLQVEEGNAASDFVSPQVEGFVATADITNCLRAGQDMKASFNLSGQPGCAGSVKLKIYNCYRETLWTKELAFKLDAKGQQQIPLDINADSIGRGVFIVQSEFFINGASYSYDYGRFSIMKFLENKHPSKNIFGIQFSGDLTTRGDALGELYKRWGFGSASYQDNTKNPEVLIKNGIANMLAQCTGTAYDPRWMPKIDREIFHEWEDMTPERAKIVEDVAFKAASNPAKYGEVWAFNTESEIHTRMWTVGHYEDFIKIQMAARAGIKKARPSAIVLLDGGTSGFAPNRGYDVIEKQLKASQSLKQTWEGLAIHPYDRYDEIDESISLFKALVDKYQTGGDTKLYVPECSAGSFINVPEWEKITQWYGDRSGRPSYDTGWREFLHAALGSRMYLIGLKYWPRVQDINLWNFRPYVDMQFAPFMLCGAVNNMGNLLGNPKFVADYMPAAGVKGLIFIDDRNCGVVAVWGNSKRVENGLSRAPSLAVKLNGLKLEYIDMMGSKRSPGVSDGVANIQLCSAPLFIKSEPGKADALKKAMMEANVLGSESAVSMKCLPDIQGKIIAELVNQTHSPLSGSLGVDGKRIDFALAAKETKSIDIGSSGGVKPGAFYDWNKQVALSLSNGFATSLPVKLTSLYVPHASAPLPENPDAPEWQKIPSFQITNAAKDRGVEGGQPGDLEAKFQAAWDERSFYLRVECKDDKFLTDQETWAKSGVDRIKTLWKYDGCVEVYFDTFSDGRFKGEQGYDSNDYRFDFYAKDASAASGPASVYRQEEVFTELAGGPSMPTKKDVENGGVKCQFKRDGDSYSYVMIFPQAYIMPLKLTKGSRSGFAIFIHDRDVLGKYKGLSLATEPGGKCFARPDLWPIMILGE